MVAEELSLPQFSLDKEEHLAAAVGYEVARYKQIGKEKGLLVAYEYRRSFYDRLVPLFLASHDLGVLDLGGGHPIASDRAKQEVIKNALAPYPHIFLLMPTLDAGESIEILRKRNQLADGIPDFNALYFKNGNRAFWEIAKFAVYTEGKTPSQTCAEVMGLLSSGMNTDGRSTN